MCFCLNGASDSYMKLVVNNWINNVLFSTDLIRLRCQSNTNQSQCITLAYSLQQLSQLLTVQKHPSELVVFISNNPETLIVINYIWFVSLKVKEAWLHTYAHWLTTKSACFVFDTSLFCVKRKYFSALVESLPMDNMDTTA